MKEVQTVYCQDLATILLIIGRGDSLWALPCLGWQEERWYHLKDRMNTHALCPNKLLQSPANTRPKLLCLMGLPRVKYHVL